MRTNIIKWNNKYLKTKYYLLFGSHISFNLLFNQTRTHIARSSNSALHYIQCQYCYLQYSSMESEKKNTNKSFIDVIQRLDMWRTTIRRGILHRQSHRHLRNNSCYFHHLKIMRAFHKCVYRWYQLHQPICIACT